MKLVLFRSFMTKLLNPGQAVLIGRRHTLDPCGERVWAQAQHTPTLGDSHSYLHMHHPRGWNWWYSHGTPGQKGLVSRSTSQDPTPPTYTERLSKALRRVWQDGRVEGYMLIFSWKISKVTTCCWTIINRRTLDPTKKKKISHIQGQRRSPSKSVGGE